MDTHSIRIRRAGEADLPALARLGQALALFHVGLDARRFVPPAGGEGDFAAFFRGELPREDAVLLVAEADTGSIAGYVFVRMEPASIEDLRAATAWLHDIYVDPNARGQGLGRRLIEAAQGAARQLGSRSLMLGVSPHNAAAKRLFERAGLRPTMIEMRMELDA